MSKETLPPEHRPVRRARTRLRRFFLRHVPLAVGAIVTLVALLLVELYFYASSASFQNLVRGRLAAALSSSTGGRVEIASFHWQLLNLEAEAGGVVIHGREAATEAPYARIEHLQAQVSVLGILTPSVRLSDLEIDQPSLHLIVYPDGTTNQPQPRRKRRAGEPAIDRLFDMKAGRVAVRGGVLDYDNRASNFDFQDRLQPLDFAAHNVSLRMNYLPASTGAESSYSIELGATELTLGRGAGKTREPEVHGRLQATVDLTRSALTLRQLRLSARDGGAAHVIEVSGVLNDFTHPHWQAKARGELDMRLLEPATGYPFAPEGIARLDLNASGTAGGFAIDGPIHVDGGAYVGTGVVARGVTLDAQVHADPYRLLISRVVARLRPGGTLEGTVDLTHWLPPAPSEARFEPAAYHPSEQNPAAGIPGFPIAPRRAAEKNTPPVLRATPLTIPVDGKVTAEFENVSLDTLLDMVSEPPFQRLGIDALLNGPAEANWAKGDDDSVVVSTSLTLSPSGRAAGSGPLAETPASGAVDATYTHRDGAVQVRRLELTLPESSLEANGRLGAYPMTSQTSLTLNFHSRRLEEFDAVLRDLGLQRGGRAGVGALPARLDGQADFNGTWTGSLLRPRIAGSLKTSQLALEMPSGEGQPRLLSFDAADVSGSYSNERIAIDQAVLQHGASKLTVNGTLDAANGPAESSGLPPPRQKEVARTAHVAAGSARPQSGNSEFNRDSILHVRVQAAKVGVDDLQSFLHAKLPASGSLDAGFEAHGPLDAIAGSGWVELDSGSLYGQPVTRVRAQGALDHTALKLAEVNASLAGGSVTASGSYDFASRRFEAKAQGAGMEIAQVAWVRQKGALVAGKMGIELSASGTRDDPQIAGRATVSGLVVDGEPLGSLEATAQTEGHAVHYDVNTLLAGAELKLHGQTDLRGGHVTDDRLEFTRFDVGALLRMAHVDSIGGQSALAGTVTLSGPLDRLEELHGEARLNQLGVTLAGVHLSSEGGAHAALAGGRIRLDPVHVTGEETDLRALGTVALTGDRRMDLAASGAINLKLAETLDTDVTASGTTTFEVEAHGTVANPGLRGRIDVQNGSMSLEDLPNGLSQMKGTLQFNQNRLEVRSLTAMTGGGLLSVGGSLTYQHGLYADLVVNGKGVRIRYPEGVSSLADAVLRLQGSPTNLLLSGNVLITRFATSPDLDLAALAAQASATVATAALPNAPSNHVRLDIHLVSSPQLNFQNAFAKLAGDVDLRLRGTVASPSLLGRVSITEGNAVIAGTHYELERGDITLTNPVRIEPVIDLTATAHVEDYDITLGLHGTPQKLAVTYRSDPPLPESDVVSLLALGHTEDQERLYTQQQEQELANPTTDALLGGALNATVSSRVQKLFGAGSVKVDPDYLGAFGNSTSRVTVQEQLGRDLVLTYATDVNTTGQQLLQAEVAINRHVSLVVARDESGVFSMVLKATRRYR